MISFVLAVNPVVETGGQIAVIIICIFMLVFVLMTLGLSLIMSFVLVWVREKTQLIRLVRPQFDDINNTTEAALQGEEPSEEKPAVVRAMVQVPARVKALDQRVERTSGRVADAVIEFRARTVQAQTIVKTFLFPDRKKAREQIPLEERIRIKSPGYNILMEEAEAELSAEEKEAIERGEAAMAVTAKQLRHAQTH